MQSIHSLYLLSPSIIELSTWSSTSWSQSGRWRAESPNIRIPRQGHLYRVVNTTKRSRDLDAGRQYPPLSPPDLYVYVTIHVQKSSSCTSSLIRDEAKEIHKQARAKKQHPELTSDYVSARGLREGARRGFWGTDGRWEYGSKNEGQATCNTFKSQSRRMYDMTHLSHRILSEGKPGMPHTSM